MRGGMSLASKRNVASATQEDRSRRQERAERILDAAAELILRWGYRKTTIDDIVKHSTLALLENSLMKAMYLNDTDMLGELASREYRSPTYPQRIENYKNYL